MILLAETKIAEAAVNFLRQFDWEVFQEVEAPGGRVDIVARRGKTIWAVEAKRSMGLSVLDQAFHWTGHANYVSVMVSGNVSALAMRICETFGIGIITTNDGKSVRVLREPTLRRRRTENIARYLREEQKDWAPAGNSVGRFYTPWKGVAMELANIVRANNGIELKKLMEAVDERFRYHYGKAPVKRNIVRWFDKGFIAGVVIKREGKEIKLYWEDHATSK